MAFIPTADVVRATITGQSAIGPVVNVLALRRLAEPTPVGLAELAELMWEQWALLVMPNLSTSYSLSSVSVADQSAADAPVAVYSTTPTPTGSVAGDALPLGSSCVVTLRTAARGRTARGRIFVGLLAEADASSGQLTPTRADGIRGAIASLGFAVNIAGWELGVLSLQENGVPRGTGLFRPVTSIVVRSPLVGTQRRRQGRK